LPGENNNNPPDPLLPQPLLPDKNYDNQTDHLLPPPSPPAETNNDKRNPLSPPPPADNNNNVVQSNPPLLSPPPAENINDKQPNPPPPPLLPGENNNNPLDPLLPPPPAENAGVDGVTSDLPSTAFQSKVNKDLGIVADIILKECSSNRWNRRQCTLSPDCPPQSTPDESIRDSALRRLLVGKSQNTDQTVFISCDCYEESIRKRAHVRYDGWKERQSVL